MTKNKGPKDKAQRVVVNEIFKVPAYYADNIYLTSLVKNKSTLARITFAQYSADNQQDHFVAAVVLSIEDLQRMYDVMGVMLQTMRQHKRLE